MTCEHPPVRGEVWTESSGLLTQRSRRQDAISHLELIEDVAAGAQLAEDRVAPVEVRGRHVRQEELAAPRVRIVVPGHAERAARGLARGEFRPQCFSRVRLRAVAVAAVVAALHDEVGDDAVERQAVEVPALDARLGGGFLKGHITWNPTTEASPFTSALEFEHIDLARIGADAGWTDGDAAGSLRGTLNLAGSSKQMERAEGNAKLRVGSQVSLSGLDARFDNDYYVTDACHLFDTRQGYRTEFTAECAYLGG